MLNPTYTQQIESACRSLAETNQALYVAVSSAVPAASASRISVRIPPGTLVWTNWTNSSVAFRVQTLLPSAQAIKLALGQLISATSAAGKQGNEPYDLVTPLEVFPAGSHLDVGIY